MNALKPILAGLEILVGRAAYRSDIVLSVMLMAIVFMLILPLPTLLVDVLIAINIGLSALLLMVAMYLPNPLAFSSFPSVLLVTTLLRLGISIATTRLVLLQADAGHIVDTFGNFVVGGNLLVGLVVFLIITIVQFIVITKGAERVAEVAARFSLDALPGKQMSIDGDMRAGSIDINTARARRSQLEKESQLYGAMDGAMKFVKGDAIASLVIVGVNLLGGFMIGTLQRDMSASEAMHTYSVLTIGDGLVAQIPGLLIAITAGIIMTRVSSAEGSEGNVGRDITQQIIGQPRALLITAAILFIFALIPGMPSAVFLPLSMLLAIVGQVLLSGKVKFGPGTVKSDDKQLVVPAMTPAGALKPQEKEPGADTFYPTVPLIMDVAQGLQPVFNPELLNDKLLEIRKGLFFDLGVPFPGIHLRYNDTLPEETYVLLLHEVPVTQGRLRPEYLLARETESNLQALGIAYEADKLFLPRTPTLWVAAAARTELDANSVSFLEPLQILANHVGVVLKRYAAEFLGVQEARFVMNRLDKQYPELVKEMQRILAPQKIAEVLQRLVSEGVSIRNLRAIGEALIDWGQKEKDSVLLTEHVRTALRRQISYHFSAGQNVLAAHILSPDVEETVRTAIRQTAAGSYLALDPDTARGIVERVKVAVGDLRLVRQMPVLLTSMDIRRYVRKLVEPELYDVPVVSYQEITPEINIQPISRIELA
jgi:type III secretion protein V